MIFAVPSVPPVAAAAVVVTSATVSDDDGGSQRAKRRLSEWPAAVRSGDRDAKSNA